MKKLILSMALLSVTIAFAQKKEVTAAFKAAQSGDVATANTQLAAAESVMGGKTELLEPAVLEQYYYAKGMSLVKAGKTAEGAQYLAKISDLGKTKIYSGKDGKNKVYYVGKAAADASGIAGLKEETYAPALSGSFGTILNTPIQDANKAAMAAYEAKNYDVAGPKFREVYDLLKAVGQDNKQYLYYSAITYAMSNDKAKAIATYNDLINSGYTGVETTYTAKNSTGTVEQIDKTQWELLKKSPNSGYTDFKTETSKSVEQELYETNVALMYDAAKYDDAIALADKGLNKFPSSAKLSEIKGLAFYKSGKTDQFINALKESVAKNPKDKDAWYNLGVLASKDPAKLAEAEGYFKKAIEIDPNYTNAYQNLTYLTMDLDNDGKVIEQFNSLRKAGKASEANKLMEARRARFAKALPYAEKWYALDSNNIDAVSLLKGLYQTTHNDAKFNEFKAKEAAMQKK